MNKFLIGLAAAAAVGVCASSQAAIVATVTNLGTPVNSGTPMAGFTAYKVNLSSNSGGLVAAVDFGVTGGAGKSFSLPLHQRWTDDPDSGLPVPSPVSVSGVTGPDSHFLFTAANVSPVSVTEDNPGSGSPISAAGAKWGIGTILSGSWAYNVGFAVASVDVAYLVIPNASLPSSGVLATPLVIEKVGGVDGALTPVVVAVPEPTSLGFVVLAGAGLIARRRKA